MDLLPVFVSLGSASLGYLAKAFVDSRMENKKQKEKEKQFKREKLEEIFSLLDKVNKNAMNPIQLYDANVDSTKLTMLIRFYFPNINDEYQKFVNEYVEVGRIKSNGENHVDAYMNVLAKSYRLLCNKIVEESKRL